MIELIKLLLDGGLIFGVCHIATLAGKCIIAYMIAHNPKMSDEKAKFFNQNDIQRY